MTDTTHQAAEPAPSELAMALFKAVQQFRNEPSLMRLVGLRKTPGYGAMCAAWTDMRDALDGLAASSAPSASGVKQCLIPEGMVLVPREPTEAMWTAGREPVMYRDMGDYRPAELAVPAWQRSPDGKVETDKSKGTAAVWVYRAMIAASPPAPTPGTLPAEVARDAERYRLLRRGNHWSVIDWKGDVLSDRALDSAVDVAIAAQPLQRLIDSGQQIDPKSYGDSHD